MIIATLSRLTFQALPLILSSLPKTMQEAAKVIIKSGYWGLIYNIRPKLIKKILPKTKTEKEKEKCA